VSRGKDLKGLVPQRKYLGEGESKQDEDCVSHDVRGASLTGEGGTRSRTRGGFEGVDNLPESGKCEKTGKDYSGTPG